MPAENKRILARVRRPGCRVLRGLWQQSDVPDNIAGRVPQVVELEAPGFGPAIRPDGRFGGGQHLTADPNQFIDRATPLSDSDA
ncbi:MAG: hypothetical protein QGG34_08420 [SAR202 cluster bacterium]|nr:hypothetical protein [SAR202 cluster bacterium]MDP7104954.1 hypothetical protein [SAR202 cluster bacterium]MDP7225254.1 hypothetical protein [SAR202 cluster bacterium]MDP7414660.1 hypothetical protein [SAR202 cluster bacterium]